MQPLYQNPLYYEIAFSFRDIAEEVDVFEACVQSYAKIPVKRFLEIGCGNSPHMEELFKRGYEYTGIDLSPDMLKFTREKAKRGGLNPDLFCQDMVIFQLEERVDFAYVMLGSLFVKNTEELHSHFDSMGRTIRAGGLYLLDWCIQFETISDHTSSWEQERDGIKVKATYSSKIVNRILQTFEETVAFEVGDRGQHIGAQDTCIRRAIYPQEFLLFISARRDFEFVGWWNNWNLSAPLNGEEEQINRPIVLLRRTEKQFG